MRFSWIPLISLALTSGALSAPGAPAQTPPALLDFARQRAESQRELAALPPTASPAELQAALARRLAVEQPAALQLAASAPAPTLVPVTAVELPAGVSAEVGEFLATRAGLHNAFAERLAGKRPASAAAVAEETIDFHVRTDAQTGTQTARAIRLGQLSERQSHRAEATALPPGLTKEFRLAIQLQHEALREQWLLIDSGWGRSPAAGAVAQGYFPSSEARRNLHRIQPRTIVPDSDSKPQK